VITPTKMLTVMSYIFYVLLVIFKLSAKCVRVCSVHCVILTAKFDCTEINAELFIIQDGPEKSGASEVI